MTKEEVKAEIAKLEEETKQLIARASFVMGAVQAYQKVLSAMLTEQKVKNDNINSPGT